MALSINQVKHGLTVLIDGEIYSIAEYSHVKPGKGSAFVRTKLRNLKTGYILERTFKEAEKIEEAFVEERKIAFSYRSNNMFHFIDQDNFEDLIITEESLSGKTAFLKENQEVSAYFYNGNLLNINMPNAIVFTVVHTEPGVKGDTAKGGSKPATIETQSVIQVPFFINIGDKIKVDTRSGEYLERIQ